VAKKNMTDDIQTPSETRDSSPTRLSARGPGERVLVKCHAGDFQFWNPVSLGDIGFKSSSISLLLKGE